MITVQFTDAQGTVAVRMRVQAGEDRAGAIGRAVRKGFGKGASILLDFHEESGLVCAHGTVRNMQIRITY